MKNGGEGGIRTPDTLSGMPVFKTGAINHSANSPSFIYNSLTAISKRSLHNYCTIVIRFSSVRKRLQRGYVYEASGRFYIRYRTDGVQKSEPLCEKTAKNYGVKAKSVQLLRDEFMLKVNTGRNGQSPEPQSIVSFFENTYLPFAKKNLRPSTVRGYQQIWAQHLKPHFLNRSLAEYKTSDMSKLLTALADDLNRNSLAHVRSTASSLFQHALNLGLVNANPIRGARALGKIKPASQTPHYSLSEAQAIISALSDSPIAQTIVGLAFFLGLRPSEISGLRWEDVGDSSISIQRAVVSGIVGPTKTPESVATLPMFEPVFSLLKNWHRINGEPKTGWVFLNQQNRPVNMINFQRTWIEPTLQQKGIEWKGLYACRRGAGSILTELTGNALAAQMILRHKNLTVTTAYYVKPSIEAGRQGLKLLEAKMRESEK
jgi:integrase